MQGAVSSLPVGGAERGKLAQNMNRECCVPSSISDLNIRHYTNTLVSQDIRHSWDNIEKVNTWELFETLQKSDILRNISPRMNCYCPRNMTFSTCKCHSKPQSSQITKLLSMVITPASEPPLPPLTCLATVWSPDMLNVSQADAKRMGTNIEK